VHPAEIVDCSAIPAGADEVMLILLWHLGDVLNSTALLPALRERHGRRLTFVTTRPSVGLLRNHPDLDRIRVVDFKVPGIVARDVWRWLAGIHEELFPGHAAVYNLHQPPDLKRMSWHIIEHWAALAGLDRRTEAWRPYFRPEGACARGPVAADYLVLGNGGTDPAKRWPAARWQRLLAALRKRHPALAYIQLGTHNDPVIEGAQDRRGATFDEGYCWITGARACVTNDSFIAHLAATTECPTVAIFGPTSSLQFGPLSPHVTALGGHHYRTQWACSRKLNRFVGTNWPCRAFPGVRRVLASTERALLLAHLRDQAT
jgi:ADP-heptose:LPS heptosyltransferase